MISTKHIVTPILTYSKIYINTKCKVIQALKIFVSSMIIIDYEGRCVFTGVSLSVLYYMQTKRALRDSLSF